MQKHIKQLGTGFDRGLICLERFLDRHGQVRVLVKDYLTKEDRTHDFVLFCIAKSIKSLKASLNLLGNEYFEDALVVLRTVYENYLTISYTYANRTDLSDLFEKKLAYSMGRLIDVRNEKGKIIKGKVLDISTNKILDYNPISVYTLAKGSEFKMDFEIHRELYKYLSEFIHPNIISSGSYRDEERKMYSINADSNFIEPMWISTYLITLILQQVNLHFKLQKNHRLSFGKALEKNVKSLLEFAQKMEDSTDPETRSLAIKLMNRLNENVQTPYI